MEGRFSVRPSVCFEVQKITGVTLGEGNQRNYQVQWAPTWISSVHLLGCEHLIEEFIQQQQSEKGQMIVHSITTADITDEHNTEKDLPDDISEDDNAPDFTCRQQVTEVYKQASMVINEDHLLKNRVSDNSVDVNDNHMNSRSFSDPADDSGDMTSLELEKDISDRGLSDTGTYECNQTNPNFEFVEKSVEDICIDRDKNYSTSLYNDRLIDKNVADTGEEDDSVFSGGLHMKQRNDNDESDNGHQNVTHVKREDIILLEIPQTDQTCLLGTDSSHNPKSLNHPSATYQCNICEKEFENNRGLALHYSRLHGIRGMFHCSICDLNCQSKARLIAHIRTHTRDRAPHKCSYCDKIFKWKCKLQQHMVCHTDERPYDCKVCKRGYRRKVNYLEHMRTKKHLEKVTEPCRTEIKDIEPS